MQVHFSVHAANISGKICLHTACNAVTFGLDSPIQPRQPSALSSTCWEGKDPIYAQARAPHQLTHLLVATAAEAAAEAVEAMRGVRGCLRAAAATRGGLAGALAGFGSRARAVERGVGRGAARGQA
jgi:hypothetical protein